MESLTHLTGEVENEVAQAQRTSFLMGDGPKYVNLLLLDVLGQLMRKSTKAWVGTEDTRIAQENMHQNVSTSMNKKYIFLRGLYTKILLVENQGNSFQPLMPFFIQL